MKVLLHYTTKKVVFSAFSKSGQFNFTNDERISEVTDFYNKYNRSQDHLFFIVSYYKNNAHTDYTACTILYDENTKNFMYKSIPDATINLICDELGLKSSSTYDKQSYYRTFTIEGSSKDFINNNKDDALNKIKMKFFNWEELLLSSEIFYEEVNNNIFNTENVFKIATTYTPQTPYTDKQKQEKYFDALKSIGFISKSGVNVNHTTLHGDIGEFLMHIMLSKFLSEESNEQYIYPKLVFKTSPKMPVYGNDGTIYLKDTKQIYYLEAKFYSDLDSAINQAVNSLISHNETDQEAISHKIELFRNIKTDELNEIVEINESVTENLVLFLICDNHREYDDMLKVVKGNAKLNDLKNKFNIILFVLPILNKEKYLTTFSEKSRDVWEELNA